MLNFAQNVKKADEGHSKVAQVNLCLLYTSDAADE